MPNDLKEIQKEFDEFVMFTDPVKVYDLYDGDDGYGVPVPVPKETYDKHVKFFKKLLAYTKNKIKLFYINHCSANGTIDYEWNDGSEEDKVKYVCLVNISKERITWYCAKYIKTVTFSVSNFTEEVHGNTQKGDTIESLFEWLKLYKCN